MAVIPIAPPPGSARRAPPTLAYLLRVVCKLILELAREIGVDVFGGGLDGWLECAGAKRIPVEALEESMLLDGGVSAGRLPVSAGNGMQGACQRVACGRMLAWRVGMIVHCHIGMLRRGPRRCGGPVHGHGGGGTQAQGPPSPSLTRGVPSGR